MIDEPVLSRAARRRPAAARPPLRPARRWPPRRSASGPAPGSAARTPATAGPPPPAHRCRRRRAGSSSSSSPAPSRSAAATSAAGTARRPPARRPARSVGTATPVALAGRRRAAAREVQLDRARARRQAQRGDRPPVQLTGMTDDRRPTSSSAQRPGCHGSRRPRSPAARPRPRARPAAPACTASAQSAGRPGPHQPRGSRSPASTTATCSGWAGSAAGLRELGVGRAAVDRRVRHRHGLAVGRTTCPTVYSASRRAPRDRLRPSASSSPGSSVVRQLGSSASSGLSTRTACRRGSSAGSPNASNTAGSTNGYGSTST